jgi:hypothetical protein
MKTSTAVWLASAVVLIAGCRSPSAPHTLAACQSGVTISVGAPTAPVFSWSPPCRAGEIIVDPVSDVVDWWVLRGAGDTNSLQPPVAYGSSPAGTVTIVGPGALQAGVTYRVRVLQATGDSTAPFYQAVGANYFSP